MGRLTGWKRIIFLITMVIVAVRIIYIGLGGEINKEYYTSKVYDLSSPEVLPCRNISVTFTGGNDKLDSLETILSNIADDKKGAVMLAITKNGKVIYQTCISLEDTANWEWEKIHINMVLEEGAEYAILMDATEECTQIPNILLVAEAADEITGSYQDGAATDGTVVINFGYRRLPGYIDRSIVISLWLIACIVVYVFLCSFEKNIGTVRGIYGRMSEFVTSGVLAAILEVFAACIIINSSGIGFQEPTKIIMYAISLLSVIKNDEKKKYLCELIDRPYKKVFLYLLYFYAAFVLTGQRLLIYPLDLKITTAAIFVFSITVFWFVSIINSLLYFLEWLCHISGCLKPKNRLKAWQFTLICTGFLLVPAFYNLLANNPGISSPDTFSCMIENAQHLHGMYDWHPAFYCMVLRVIEEISNTTYAVIAVQYFFWAYVVNELLLYLREKGIRENILIVAAAFSGLNAANIIHLNTIWKDIPYTFSLLWIFVILAKMSIDYDKYKGNWYIYLEYIVAMVGVCLYRKNGTVSFIIIAISVIVVLRKSARAWIATILAATMIFAIKGPVYDYFEVVDSERHGIYIGLGQDILGVYYYDGDVSEDTLEMITRMTGYNNSQYQYNPTWSRAAYDIDVEPVEFIKRYIDTFIKNPVLMVRAVIDREDALWDIFKGEDTTLGCVNSIGTEDTDERYNWNDYYPKRKYISIYEEMLAATSYTANTQWINAIEWRCGVFTLLGLIATVFVIFKKGKGKYLMLLMPMAGHIMSLLLSTGWSDFRYFWPMNLLNTAWILVVLVVVNVNEGAGASKQLEKA